MSASPTPVRIVDPEPLTFRPKGPPRPLRRALNAAYDVFVRESGAQA